MKYTYTDKQKIVKFSYMHGVEATAEKFNVGQVSVFRWRREIETLEVETIRSKQILNKEYKEMSTAQLRALLLGYRIMASNSRDLRKDTVNVKRRTYTKNL